MGFSQLDRPIFEKYRLVKEDDVEPIKADPKSDEQTKLAEIDKVKEELESLRAEVDELKKDSCKILDEINKKPSKKKDGE
jgi:flagellar motility protein MotE (MotC chaperone)